MIIAMPMSRERLASHFTKAVKIGFYNEQFQLIKLVDSPAIEGDCSAKKALLELIIQQGTDIVIAQNIGERMLGKLLDAGISVSKGSTSQTVATLLAQTADLNLRLTDASQGRASLKHAAKGGCCHSIGDGCGCSGKAKAASCSTRLISTPAAQVTLDKSVHYAGFRPLIHKSSQC
ncbi:NifB/NifX family molybdenum-iron cluster-binding protein [Shewanella baltica]|uniref:NifB/NifX family molybdenum-iron cluster-binding protein n=1 Tax=Shewanella baltica TaxID=62322 RepID=UPI00217F14C2|nr:NifB/NifX family molybdenum-iron cluster-binding protein [Shewanella baltica]MCS6096145.1 dinitrogenase iron-molybdenum cofactor biosynthesis protein [Shewanella baltica]MCS6227253.1 dinitrogenase iron-molybdenum cofactor biosynthesis protein [Shewanella baltica]